MTASELKDILIRRLNEAFALGCDCIASNKDLDEIEQQTTIQLSTIVVETFIEIWKIDHKIKDIPQNSA